MLKLNITNPCFRRSRQKSLDEMVVSMKARNTFQDRLTRALVSADIPFEKLSNKHFKQFLEDEMKTKIPDPTTLRKNYVHKQSEMIIGVPWKNFADSNVYFMIDETTDPKIRYCVNVMVGPLNGQTCRPMTFECGIR